LNASLSRAIGRVIWVGIRGAEPGDGLLDDELRRCADCGVGGIILFDIDVPELVRLREAGAPEDEARRRAPRNIRSPDQTRDLVRLIRERLGPGIVVCVDQEGGAVSRLSPAWGFEACPPARDFGRMSGGERSAKARTLAHVVASVGIDLNLAPCLDVEITPDGPGHTALGRSFGRDPARVAACAEEQIEAMHAAGVGACVKHFPGHGSAWGDSHEGLIDITETFEAGDELLPYRTLVQRERSDPGRPDAVMVSHLLHRALDPERPCSLSPRVINDLLRRDIGWEGPVLTDSLDMRAIAARLGPGAAGVQALRAGADIVLEANNLTERAPCPAPEIHGAIGRAIEAGDLAEERVLEAASRIDALRERLDELAASGEHAS